ncbi:DHHW family protein [Sinanaerobacter sp. ZZT-01]|uniref:DHHW family protein n=1 Tax=Sinanaerobacter sp. ZZT-01 TaxID=3111540 RepID=UPI002D77B6CB|nr:DHHW family protein [Sinanaerobacter sp. ZZT-01]WRR94140.1 DHHW family protein [Sinanaerobacter sp. ZZT-01]
MNEKNINRITVWVFLSLIIGFAICNHILPQMSFSENENRSLVLFSKPNVKEIKNGRWMKSFEQYASDQFLFRDNFMRIKTKTDRMLGKMDNGKVYFGKDGYLISMDRPDQRQQAANSSLLCTFIKRMGVAEKQKNQISVSILMLPSVSSVECEKLPQFTPVFEEEREIKRLEEQIKQISQNAIFVDGAAPLLSAKKNGTQLYYRNDHHWTTFGAYEVYRYWAEKNGFVPYDKEAFQIRLVSESFYGTNQAKALGAETVADKIYSWTFIDEPKYSIEIPAENLVKHSLYEESFLRKKDKYAYFLGGNVGEMLIHTPIKNGRNLMVIKDSYANCFIPFLCGHYESITVIDPRYYRGVICDTIQENGVNEVLFLYSFLQFSNDRNFVYGVR